MIEPGSPADLAYLASISPHFFCAERLLAARERLKQGHGLFIARQENRVVATVWLAVLEGIRTSWQGAPDLEIVLGAPAPLIDFCWTIPGEPFSLIGIIVLDRLAQVGLREHDRVWACFTRTGLNLKRYLDAAGWVLRRRMVRVKCVTG